MWKPSTGTVRSTSRRATQRMNWQEFWSPCACASRHSKPRTSASVPEAIELSLREERFQPAQRLQHLPQRTLSNLIFELLLQLVEGANHPHRASLPLRL